MPVVDTSWGDDRLGANEALAFGQSTTVILAPDTWDLRAIDTWDLRAIDADTLVNKTCVAGDSDTWVVILDDMN